MSDNTIRRRITITVAAVAAVLGFAVAPAVGVIGAQSSPNMHHVLGATPDIKHI